ncbi:MAG: pirin family protein [Bacteroidota bacterium]
MNHPVIRVQPLQFPWQTQDPFLFCAYHLDDYPPGDPNLGPGAAATRGRAIGQDFAPHRAWRMYHGAQVPGFPYHPHRGFETVTIVKQGVVDHTDSLGGAGRFMNGDVQWMTAGKGIQHSEMFPLLAQDRGNPLELFQIWLNLPQSSKMVEPHYKMLWREDIPTVERRDAAGRGTFIDLVAGRFAERTAPAPTPDSWAADPAHAVSIFTVRMEPEAEWTLPATATGATRSAYFYRGDRVSIGGQSVAENYVTTLRADAEIAFRNGAVEGYLLILEGQPISEPVAQHGPFVMNTEQEIREAFAEYRRTEFGGWPWPEREQVHGRDRGRFARYADGSEERK